MGRGSGQPALWPVPSHVDKAENGIRRSGDQVPVAPSHPCDCLSEPQFTCLYIQIIQRCPVELSALSSKVSSLMSQLTPENRANATETLNFNFNFILMN